MSMDSVGFNTQIQNKYNSRTQQIPNSTVFGQNLIEKFQSDTFNKQAQPIQAVNQPPVVEKGLTTTQKWAIGLGTVAIIGAGVLFATRGKKIKLSSAQESKLKDLVLNKKINEKHVDLFKSIEHLEGEEFIKKAYTKIAESMGYKNKPPLEIVAKNSTSASSHGLKITIDKLGFKTKEEQLRTIRHELEHFRQNDLIYRTFGKETYLDALAQPAVRKLQLNEEFCIKKMGKKYSELTKTEIEIFIKDAKATCDKPERFNLFESILKEKGKIKAGTAEYTEAEKLLEASRNYITPSMLVNEPLTSELIRKIKLENPDKYKQLQDIGTQYYSNALEVGANTKGYGMEEAYKLFKEVFQN